MDFFLLAFLLAQPTSPAEASRAADGGTPPPLMDTARLRSPVEITARKVEFSSRSNQAEFIDEVLVKHRTLELRCDRMVAWYTSPREVKRVECTGGVQAQDQDRYARGERAEYDVSTGVLVVTGSPEARQGTTYLKGTKVRLTLGSERVEVENARIVIESSPGKGGKPGTKKP